MTNPEHPKRSNLLIRCYNWMGSVTPLHSLALRLSTTGAILLTSCRFLLQMLSVTGPEEYFRDLARSGALLTIFFALAMFVSKKIFGAGRAFRAYPLLAVMLSISLCMLWIGLAFSPKLGVEYAILDSVIVGMSFLVMSYLSGFAFILMPSNCHNNSQDEK